MYRLLGVAVLSVSICSLAGCSGSDFADPVPVTGTVTYQGDPVSDALVTFLAKGQGGRSASGRTDAQGNFSLTTFSTGDGAIPGEYNVTIAKVDSEMASADIDVASGEDPGAAYGAMMDSAGDDASMATMQDSSLPEKYAQAGESGLVREVAATGENKFGFDLE